MTVTDAAAGGGGFVGAVCEVLDGEAAAFIGVGVTEFDPAFNRPAVNPRRLSAARAHREGRLQ